MLGENIWNKESRTVEKWCSSMLGVGWGLTIPHHKKRTFYKMSHMVSDLAGFCEHGNEPPGSITGGECLD